MSPFRARKIDPGFLRVNFTLEMADAIAPYISSLFVDYELQQKSMSYSGNASAGKTITLASVENAKFYGCEIWSGWCLKRTSGSNYIGNGSIEYSCFAYTWPSHPFQLLIITYVNSDTRINSTDIFIEMSNSKLQLRCGDYWLEEMQIDIVAFY